MKKAPKAKHVYGVVGVVATLAVTAYFLLPQAMSRSYVSDEAKQAAQERIEELALTADTEVTLEEEPKPSAEGYPNNYVPTPSAVKAIYMSQCVAGTPNFRADLIKLVEDTELNAIIIDIKDYSGGLGYPFENPVLAPFISDECGAWDMPSLLSEMHEKGIYTIARITVFQDPKYAKVHPNLAVQSLSTGGPWRDNKGLNFIDVSAKPFWEYIVTLSRETHKLGFDELNFDYVRFPSDGPMADASFTHSVGMGKAEALEHFFEHLHAELTNPATYPEGIEPPVLSADLFGFTTSNTDDLSIGQVIERALPYFDYIAPMVYPSHYPNGSFGYANPNNYPYEIIHRAMSDGVARAVAPTTVVEGFKHEPIMETITIPGNGSTTATTTQERFTGRYTKPIYDKQKLRPWLQDFDYGGDYDIAEVREQIAATYDTGLTSWMLWAPSNRYTKGALEPFYSGIGD